MKKVFCLFLSMVLTFSIFIPAFAEEKKEYTTFKVEYSDKLGAIEKLNVMVKNNQVYVDVKQLAERFGYSVSVVPGNHILIKNIITTTSTPVMAMVYYFDSKKVWYLCGTQDCIYEAPFETIEDDKGIWAPFTYTLKALNSDKMIVGDVIEIEMPQKKLMDLIFEVSDNFYEIDFDYFTDTGYTQNKMTASKVLNRYINLLSGILEFEGESWALMFQQFYGDNSAYHDKYSEKVMKLLCVNSDKELEAMNKQISLLNDVFSENGQLGKALSKMKFDIDSDVKSLYNQCEMLRKNISDSNSNLSKFNAKYQRFEKAFDKQTWFSETGENIMKVQKGLAEATQALEVLGKVAEVVGYIDEYARKDAYSVDAVNNYLTKFEDATYLSKKYIQALKFNANLFKADIADYAIVNFIRDNAASFVLETGLSFGAQLSAQANVALLVWNIAANTIPFIKNGLSAADNFDLSRYCHALQVDTFLQYKDFRSEIFDNEENATIAEAYDLSQFLYMFLKSAYITRDAAVGSFDNVKDKEGVAEALAKMAEPNEKIAGYLARLKMMSKDNKDLSIGFFKENSDWLVQNYDDSDLLKLLGNSNNSSATSQPDDKDTSDNTQPSDNTNPSYNRETSDERDIVLVLDISSSMSGTPMNETKKAASKFISTILKEDASIGIVVYNEEAKVLSDFSKNEQNLTSVISEIRDSGVTNIDDGLTKANALLQNSNAEKKIIVLMSDGMPNRGRQGDELISFADSIKDSGTYIYTLGFFSNSGSSKSAAQKLMEDIASEGCHYEVASADDLVFFFGDIADQINGQKFIYVRIACPVDVTVSYGKETLSSSEKDFNNRTSFGALSLEDIENSDDKVKTLRLKDGIDYDIKIEGTGRGKMDYTIGYMDDNGDYSDMRNFRNIDITRRTVIDTSTKQSGKTILNVDEDGDGRYDMKFRAGANEYGELVDYTYLIYIAVGFLSLSFILLCYIKYRSSKRKKG